MATIKAGAFDSQSGLEDDVVIEVGGNVVARFDETGLVGAENGGSTPADAAGLLFSSTGSTPDQPTFAQAVERNPNLFYSEWLPLFDYGTAVGTTDGVVYLHPIGSDNVYATETYNEYFSGDVEPDWAGDAPNLGDQVSDGDLTWTNIGLFSGYPPVPTTWQAETEYAPMAAVWPTTPDGNVWVAFPPGPLTSGSSEPDWSAAAVGAYVSDGDGYWFNAGPGLAAAPFSGEWSAAAVAEATAGAEAPPLALISPGGAANDSLLPALDLKTPDSNRTTSGLVRFWNLAINRLTEISRIYTNVLNYTDKNGDPVQVLKWDGFDKWGLILDFDGFMRFQVNTKTFIRVIDGSFVPVIFGEAVNAAPLDDELAAKEAALWFTDTGVHFKRRSDDGNTIQTLDIIWD